MSGERFWTDDEALRHARVWAKSDYRVEYEADPHFKALAITLGRALLKLHSSLRSAEAELELAKAKEKGWL